jgi:hypothetical protein
MKVKVLLCGTGTDFLLFSVFQTHSTPSRFSLDLDLGGEIKRRNGKSFDRSAQKYIHNRALLV